MASIYDFSFFVMSNTQSYFAMNQFDLNSHVHVGLLVLICNLQIR